VPKHGKTLLFPPKLAVYRVRF